MDFPGRDQLFAFATPAEFASFFPEYADTADEITSDKLIELSGGCGYACILGIGILNFATNLTFLLGDAKRRGISISPCLFSASAAHIPAAGSKFADVVRVDTELLAIWGIRHVTAILSVPGSVRADGATGESPVPHLQKLEVYACCRTVNCCTGTEYLALRPFRMFDADIEKYGRRCLLCRLHALWRSGLPNPRRKQHRYQPRHVYPGRFPKPSAALRKCVGAGQS